MTLDQTLFGLLAFALLVRYHRSVLAQAEERFQKCDQERVQLHNFFYGRDGVSLTDVGNQTEPAAETPLTPEEKYQEKKDWIKLQLKRIAKTRTSDLGPVLRNLEKQRRPRLRNIRPNLDPQTAAQVKEQITNSFAAIKDQVTNGRST